MSDSNTRYGTQHDFTTRENAPGDLQLEGFEVIERVYSGTSSMIFKARRLPDGSGVVLKTPHEQHPAPEVFNAYRVEKAALDPIRSELVIRAFDLTSSAHRPVLVLEHFSGPTLKQCIRETQFSLKQSLDIAAHIIQGLGEVHAARVIHRDLNPHNILFDQRTSALKLIDFDNAVILDSSTRSIRPAGMLRGTLPYISPEQSGRLNRFLDFRSDFYSLGVTLYELLSGRLPFDFTDPLQLVHAHTALRPKPLNKMDSDIPEPLSDFVDKLMAKRAEDRYQSVQGILADLSRIKTLLKKKRITSFRLGRSDAAGDLDFTGPPVGRTKEVSDLKENLSSVARGDRPVLLVSGDPGIGKTTLVLELIPFTMELGGLFVTGKFEQQERNEPFGGLVQALRDAIRLYLIRPEQELRQLAGRLRTTLGNHCSLLTSILPDLELIIGPQPSAAPFNPDHSPGRFSAVFRIFIREMCSPQQPLVLFLDDLHWADTTSLQLLSELAADASIQGLCLLGAFRHRAIGPGHPLSDWIEAMDCDHQPFLQLHLGPLRNDHVAFWLAQVTGGKASALHPLATLLTGKTGGNPLYLKQFLTSLSDESLLTYSRRTRGWTWDLDGIRSHDLSSNMAEIFSRLIADLPLATQRLLRMAACLGHAFDLRMLSVVADAPVDEIHADLTPALHALIQPVSDMEPLDPHALLTPLFIFRYAFLHDRIQMTAYTQLPTLERQAVHLAAGRFLLESLGEEERQERIFELADHLNAGRELISRSERPAVVRVNLEASRKARLATAFDAALNYVTSAASLADNLTNLDVATHFELLHEHAEVEALCGRFEPAIKRIRKGLDSGFTRLQKAKLYFLLVSAHLMEQDGAGACSAGIEGLRFLGMRIPEDDLKPAVIEEDRKVRELLTSKKLKKLSQAPPLSDPEKTVLMRIVGNMSMGAMNHDPMLWQLTILYTTRFSLEHGLLPEATPTLAAYGLSLNARSDRDRGLAYDLGQLSLDLAKRFEVPREQAIIASMNCISLMPWRAHQRDVSELARDTFHLVTTFGEVFFPSAYLFNVLATRYYCGDPLPAIKEALLDNASYLLLPANQYDAFYCTTLHSLLAKLLDDQDNYQNIPLPDVSTLLGSEQLPQHKMLLFCYWTFTAQGHFLRGEPAQAWHCLQQAEVFLADSSGSALRAEYDLIRILAAEAMGRRLDAGDASKGLAATLEESLDRLRQDARDCQANFAHKLLLARAALAGMKGRISQALDLYEKALQSAEEQGFTHYAALAAELVGKLWLKKGNRRIGATYLTRAWKGFRQWGAGLKLKEMEARYPGLIDRDTLAVAPMDATLKAYVSGDSTDPISLDLASVIKAAQAISAEIEHVPLVSHLVQVVLENAGARKGFLVTKVNDELRVAAGAKENSAPESYDLALADCPQIPRSIVDYTLRTGEPLICDNAAKDSRFAADKEVHAKGSCSLLCLPVTHKGRIIALFYLENDLVSGAFTPSRLNILHLIASQAAISLENARLFQELKGVSQDLLRAQENERRRIARDLHDQISQDLSALKIFAESLFHGRLDPEAIAMRSDLFTTTLKKVIADVRHLTNSLRPPSLADIGITETLGQLCHDFAANYDIAVDYHAPGMENVVLNPDTATHIYRIVQESLNNIRKHAKATGVVVRIVESSRKLILRIRDDGCGFDVAKRSAEARRQKRMGLQNLRERAELLQADLTIRSTPGTGTEITLKMDYTE